MTGTATVGRRRDDREPGSPPVVGPELADQLLARLLGPDGLLSQVTRAVLERALGEERTAHLGYEKHDPAGRGSGNSRNGTTPRTGTVRKITLSLCRSVALSVVTVRGVSWSRIRWRRRSNPRA
jgi:transposase-like protein